MKNRPEFERLHETAWCRCYHCFVDVGSIPAIGYRCRSHCPAEPAAETAQRRRGVRPASWPKEPPLAETTPPGARVLREDVAPSRRMQHRSFEPKHTRTSEDSRRGERPFRPITLASCARLNAPPFVQD